jgi:LacI family transcriptional regulator
LTDNGISFDESLVFYNNLSDQAGIEVADVIKKMPVKPDGIFSANDACAVSCIRELKLFGIKIPDDLAVAGFNNDPLSKVIEPNLTSVDYPGQEMGEVAASILIRRLEKREGVSLNTMVLRHQLIIRESSRRK